MKSFKSLIFTGLVLAVGSAAGQVVEGAMGYYNEALLFSQTSPVYGSTARMQAIGGAQVSLGADMSLVGSNPAGLGFFNRSVVSFTPSMNFHNSDALYQGRSLNTFRNNFNFANLGIVFNQNKGDYTSEKFKGGSFAISLNRTNNFNNEVMYQGRNGNNSIIDSFLENAGTTLPNNLPGYEYSAYENYLINPDYDENDALLGYGSFVEGFPEQSETIRTSGGQYQMNFAWGGNYDDKVYFGGGIGLATLRYSRLRTYREQEFLFENQSGEMVIDDWINYTEIRDEITINGTGINTTLGVIVRPLNMVTVGVSYVSPTYYALDEESGFRHNTSWNGVDIEDDEGEVVTTLNDLSYVSDLVISRYNLRTPARVNVGATVFLGKMGFITSDVEFVDYSGSQLKSNDFSVVADNETIGNLYSNAVNFRLGGEFRMDSFRFRGGYAYFADPISSNSFDDSRQNITFGVGYRNPDFFIDLGVINSKYRNQYSPYFISQDQPIADIENRTTTASVTVGFNF